MEMVQKDAAHGDQHCDQIAAVKEKIRAGSSHRLSRKQERMDEHATFYAWLIRFDNYIGRNSGRDVLLII